VSADEDRFAELYDAHYDRVLRYAARRVDPDTARDVAAETFLVAWRRLSAVPDEPLPWLIRVAANVLANENRGRRRDLRLQARLGAHHVDAADHAGAVVGVDRVRQALEQLSARDRELLQLIGWDELDAAGAAEVLGCSARTLAVRLHRARRRLAKSLEAQDQSQPVLQIERGRA